jgi:DNA-binding NarL/FixJ family response regulator
MLRLLIADHRLFFRLGIASALAKNTEIELLPESTNSSSLPYLCHRFSPTVLLLNLHLPGLNLPALSNTLRRDCPTLSWLFLLEPGEERTTDLQLLLQTGGGQALS